MAQLLYGAGLRLLECCRLRVKDVDLGRREITVRDGKGRECGWQWVFPAARLYEDPATRAAADTTASALQVWSQLPCRAVCECAKSAN